MTFTGASLAQRGQHIRLAGRGSVLTKLMFRWPKGHHVLAKRGLWEAKVCRNAGNAGIGSDYYLWPWMTFLSSEKFWFLLNEVFLNANIDIEKTHPSDMGEGWNAGEQGFSIDIRSSAIHPMLPSLAVPSRIWAIRRQRPPGWYGTMNADPGVEAAHMPHLPCLCARPPGCWYVLHLWSPLFGVTDAVFCSWREST